MRERQYKVDEFKNRAPGSDPHYQSVCRSMVAVVRGNELEAITQIERAIDGFVALGDIQGEGRARAKAVILFRRFGHAQRTLQQATRALECLRKRPDAGYEAHVYLELGQLAAGQGNAEAASAHYEMGLQVTSTYGKGEDEIVTTARAFLSDCAATCLAMAGKWNRVEGLRRSAIESLKALNAPHLDRDLVITYSNLARDYVFTGRLGLVEPALADAKAILHAMEKRGDIDPECRGSYEGVCAEYEERLLRSRS